MLRKLIKLNVRSEKNCISSSLLDLCNKPAFSAVAHWTLPLDIGLYKLLRIIMQHYGLPTQQGQGLTGLQDVRVCRENILILERKSHLSTDNRCSSTNLRSSENGAIVSSSGLNKSSTFYYSQRLDWHKQYCYEIIPRVRKTKENS